MKNISPFLAFLSLFLFISCTSTKNSDQEPTKRPNILLIMTDDQGWGDLGIHGNDSISTPNLDQFAREAVSFDRFYVSPVCAPTRASLLTGRYHLRTGTSWVTHRKEVMRSGEVTISEYLKKAGYRTGIFGKWHNGEQYPNDPKGQGFDDFLGFKAGHWNNYFDPVLYHNDTLGKHEGFISDIFTNAAINWMGQKSEEPFFCYIPYNAPHGPFQVPDKYFDKYKKAGLNDKNAAVYGMVENIDDNVGRLLSFLKDQQLADNTIVLFLTDNGPNGKRFNGGMRGTKASNHEGGMRVPLFIKWGDHLSPGKVIKPLAAHIDLLPTLLDLSNIDYKPVLPLDGRSLKPLLLEETVDWPARQLYHIQTDGKKSILHSAVRSEQHRFVINRDSSMQLFDMQADPGQKQNIIDDHPDLAKKYLADLEEWFADVTSADITAPPIPVGQLAFGHVSLPAHEAQLNGQLRFQGKMGWANDYIIDWNSVQDSLKWPIEVAQKGQYEVRMHYVASNMAVGSSYRLAAHKADLEGEIEAAYYPDFLPSPDRIKRGEVYERVWKVETIGALNLEKGRQDLVLHPLDLPRQQFVELKELELIRKF